VCEVTEGLAKSGKKRMQRDGSEKSETSGYHHRMSILSQKDRLYQPEDAEKACSRKIDV